jgi:predicted esterase
MRNLSVSIIACIISLMLGQCKSSPGEAGPPSHDTAVAIQTIQCRADTGQTYCIALPPDFNPARRYPVVFVFDPHGDGQLAVRNCIAGACEFGFIVAGSNVIRNGYENIEYALKIFTDDVFSRYPADMNRIYAAGFSGGGRVVQQFSQLNTDIKSIVVMGAGYSLSQYGQLRNDVSMLFITGNEDFNYHEVMNSENVLSAMKIRHYILEFNGKHGWPGLDIMHDAMLWFEFDAYHRDHGSKDNRTVREFLEKTSQQASLQEEDHDLSGAANTCNKGIVFLSGIAGTTSLEKKLAAIRKDDAFRQSMKRLDDAMKMESRLQQGYLLAMREQDTLWWRNEIAALDEKIKNGHDDVMQPVYNRIRNFLSIAAYSMCNASLNQNDLKNAERYVSIYQVIDPLNPDVYYFGSLFQSKSGHLKEARELFRKSVVLGFSDFKKAAQELPRAVMLDIKSPE